MKRWRCAYFQASQRAKRPSRVATSAPPQGGRALGDALDLVGEQEPDQEVGGGPEQGPRGIPQEEPRASHADHPRHGRSDRVEPGEELGEEERSRTLGREDVLGAADARVRLERDPAQQLQDGGAPSPSRLEPHEVGDEARGHRQEQRRQRVQLVRPDKRSGSEQEGHGGQRQAELLGEHGPEEDEVGVLEKEGEGAVHGWDRLSPVAGRAVDRRVAGHRRPSRRGPEVLLVASLPTWPIFR